MIRLPLSGASHRAARLVLFAGVVCARGLAAQDVSGARLDSVTAATVARIADSVRARSLPAEQIFSLAHEGALHHASPEQVIAAVREYAAALGEARNALGRSATSEEIVSGAGLLVAHIMPSMLAGLRAARPGGALTVPLVVFADFVARDVTPELAFTTIASALRDGADDNDLSALRNVVADAIRAGRSPAAAVADGYRVLPEPHHPGSPATPGRRGRPPTFY